VITGISSQRLCLLSPMGAVQSRMQRPPLLDLSLQFKTPTMLCCKHKSKESFDDEKRVMWLEVDYQKVMSSSLNSIARSK
jgi:hypothetical protein